MGNLDLGQRFKSVTLDPLTIWHIYFFFFFFFFWKVRIDTDEKVDLRNNKRPSTHPKIKTTITVDSKLYLPRNRKNCKKDCIISLRMVTTFFHIFQ